MIALLVCQIATGIVLIARYLTPTTVSSGLLISSSPILPAEDLTVSFWLILPVLWLMTPLVAVAARSAVLPRSSRFEGVLYGIMVLGFFSFVSMLAGRSLLGFVFLEGSFLGAMLFLTRALVKIGRGRYLHPAVPTPSGGSGAGGFNGL